MISQKQHSKAQLHRKVSFFNLDIKAHLKKLRSALLASLRSAVFLE